MLKVVLKQQLLLKTSLKSKELTKSGKELHSLHVKSLKEKLSGCGIDPFTFGYIFGIN